MINRKVFFDRIRMSIFRGAIPNEAVVGCNAILDEWERRGLSDLRHLAYMLATVRGECGQNMLPVREGFSKSDAAARAFVARHGYKYAEIIAGNVYYGRGLVQLTWHRNYAAMAELLKEPLVSDPDRALKPDIAAKIMFEGMARGTFTGKRLSDYLNGVKTDYVNARRIINGTDKAAQFAAWAVQFHDALQAAAIVAPAPPDVEPVPKPAPKSPNNKGAAGVVVAGGTAGGVIVNETSKKGATFGDLVMVGVMVAIIVGAVALTIRNWRR